MRLDYDHLEEANKLAGSRIFVRNYSAERLGNEEGYPLNEPGILVDDSYYIKVKFDKKIRIHDGFINRTVRFFWIEGELDPDGNY